MQPLWRRYAPLAAMALALVAFFGLRLDRYASFELLVDSRARLMDYIGRHFAAAFGAFILTYAALVAISAPGATLMTVAGGALFGVAWGLVGSVVGATAGACGLFLAARSALGETLAARAGPKVLRLRDRFKEHAVGYLLFLRMSPLFPFWFVNLAAALSDDVHATSFLPPAPGLSRLRPPLSAARAPLPSVPGRELRQCRTCESRWWR